MKPADRAMACDDSSYNAFRSRPRTTFLARFVCLPVLIIGVSLASGVGATSASHTQASTSKAEIREIVVEPAIMVWAKARQSRIEQRQSQPAIRTDPNGDHPDAIGLKNRLLADGVLSEQDRTILRGVFSGSDRLLISADGQSIEVPNLRYRSALQVLARVLGDEKDCASRYWLLGAFEPALQQQGLERARAAAIRYAQAHPGTDMAGLEQTIVSGGQARLQRIQSAQESAEALGDDLRACDLLMGF